MNRKGELDKAIAGVPILILVFLILSVFVVISTGMFGVKGISSKEPVISSTHMPLVFDEISFKNSSGQDEDMIVLQAIRKYRFSEGVEEGLMSLVPEKGCFYLAYVSYIKNIQPGVLFYKNGIKQESGLIDDFSNSGANFYNNNPKVSNYTFSFLDEPLEKYTIQTYVGECLDE